MHSLIFYVSIQNQSNSSLSSAFLFLDGHYSAPISFRPSIFLKPRATPLIKLQRPAGETVNDTSEHLATTETMLEDLRRCDEEEMKERTVKERMTQFLYQMLIWQ